MLFINSPLEQFKINTFMGITSPIADLSIFSLTTFTLYTGLVVLSIIFVFVLALDRKLIVGSN
jgi:hypothetical protein